MAAIWYPSKERIAAATVTRFIECVNTHLRLSLKDYWDLYTWSVMRPEQFWIELAQFADVRAEWGRGPVIEQPAGMLGARFFPDTKLNFAENLLRYRDEHPAVVFTNERDARRALSYAQLHAEVARVAAGLAQAGVGIGDRVAGYLPNLPEALIAMLATTSLGAVWSACSPDFGVNALRDRFAQIEPKVLFTADGYFYAGKAFDSLPQIAAVAAQLPSVRRIVVVPYVAQRPDLAHLGAVASHAALWSEFGTSGAPLRFAPVPFNHPVYILYSSGTTGVPKCIVHGVGGTLLAHQKEHLLHVDLRRGDRIFYFTTCGWMMWNWLASALAVGATLVLYDGNPFFPDPGVLWRMAEREQVTVFGTSAKYLSALEKTGYVPVETLRLRSLKTILSTGSPLLPESFDFVYRAIKADVHLASISGGTDIISCFALGCPTLPVYRGELQCRGLGMRVEIFNDAGEPLHGARGELVCTAPFPSMPLGFWNDPHGAKFRAAYFERYPGVWHHGDYAELTEHGGILIHGRSDAVLNPGGVRIGTAEIYAAVDSLPEIAESIAVGQDWKADVRVVLFVRLNPAVDLDEELKNKIRDAIRTHASPRHVPAKIIAVTDIPRTRSGKLSELAVREVIHNRRVHNIDALANPSALDNFRNVPELAQ